MVKERKKKEDQHINEHTEKFCKATEPSLKEKKEKGRESKKRGWLFVLEVANDEAGDAPSYRSSCHS